MSFELFWNVSERYDVFSDALGCSEELSVFFMSFERLQKVTEASEVLSHVQGVFWDVLRHSAAYT